MADRLAGHTALRVGFLAHFQPKSPFMDLTVQVNVEQSSLLVYLF